MRTIKFPAAYFFKCLSILICLLPLFMLPYGLQAQEWKWAVSSSGTGNEGGRSVDTDSNGNIYVTGSFSGYATFGPYYFVSAGGTDIFILKYDPNGNLLWATTAGGPGDDAGTTISVTPNGTVFIGGTYTEPAYFEGFILEDPTLDVGSPIFLAKYESNGNFQQAYNVILDGGYISIPTKYTIEEVIALDDHRVLFTCNRFDTQNTINDEFTAFVGLVDLDIAGPQGFNWRRNLTKFDVSNQISVVSGMTAFNEEAVYITGNFFGELCFDRHFSSCNTTPLTSFGNSDIYIAKYTSTALLDFGYPLEDLIWAIQIEETSGTITSNSISHDAAGNIYIAGNLTGSADFGNGITLNVTDQQDAFIAKYDSTGNILWAQKSANDGFFSAESIVTSTAGDSYITGRMKGSNGFGSLNMAAAGEDDIYLVKFDTNGNPIWGYQVEDLQNTAPQVFDIALDPQNNRYITGEFAGNILFDYLTLTPNTPGSEVFLGKLGDYTLVASAGLDHSITCAGSLTIMRLDGSGSEGDITSYTWTGSFGTATGVNPTLELAPGRHAITLTVSDGTNTASDEIFVTIEDDSPPLIMVQEDPIILWPADQRYHTVKIADMVLELREVCDEELTLEDVMIQSVSSDEPEYTPGEDDTYNDIILSDDCQSVLLRAEHLERGNGRVYTVNMAIQDHSGNEGTTSFQIQVPTDIKVDPLDDGPQYTEWACGTEQRTMTNSQTFAPGSLNAQGISPEATNLSTYPNPFSNTTKIVYALDEPANVLLEVFNVQGNKIATLVENNQKAGYHEVTFDGSELESGVYFALFQTGSTYMVTKVILLE